MTATPIHIEKKRNLLSLLVQFGFPPHPLEQKEQKTSTVNSQIIYTKVCLYSAHNTYTRRDIDK